MKKLYHPGIPCNLILKNNLETKLSDIEGPLEVVNCTEGFGVLSKEWFWADESEARQLTERRDTKIKNIRHRESAYKGWGFYSPLELFIELTKRCNQECVHCWNDSGQEQPSTDINILKRVIMEFREGCGQKLEIMGGEPLSYSNLLEFLGFCKTEGVRQIELTSNGILINDKSANFLSKLVDKISISLHGSKPDLHNSITQNPKSYSSAIKNIHLLQSVGINPEIKYTVMPKNKNDVEDMILLAESLGVSGIRFNCLKNIGRASNLPCLSKDEVSVIRNLIYKKSKECGVKILKSELYPKGYEEGIQEAKFYGCDGLRTSMYIYADGSVTPCSILDYKIGNIKDLSIHELWENERAAKFRSEPCCNSELTCPIKKECGGKCRA